MQVELKGPFLARLQGLSSSLILWISVASCRAGQEQETYTYDAAGRLATAICVSGGTHTAFHYTYDLAGNRQRERIYGPGSQTVDDDVNGLPDLWELACFGSLGNSAMGDPDGDGLFNGDEMALGGNPLLADTDGDGQSDYDEFVAGTGLTNAASYFGIIDTSNKVSETAVRISSVSGRQYWLQRAATLAAGAWTNVAGAGPVSGTGNPLALRDTNAAPRAFYRVEVKGP